MAPRRSRIRPMRRVTMDDIAKIAKVHRSTVSLALRGQSKIPAVTRQRIQRLATKLGYAPDPLLDAFNFRRQSVRPARAVRSLAFLSDLAGRKEFDASPLHTHALAGAVERAEQLGFSVDLFFIGGADRLSPVRLNQVLSARGISCVMIGAFRPETETSDLEWQRYCAVAIESSHIRPSLDTITLDYRAAALITVQELRQKGHVRIGFIGAEKDAPYLGHRPLAGYLLAQRHDRCACVPPLILKHESEFKTGAVIEKWIRKNRLTAVVVASDTLLISLRDQQRSGFAIEWAGPAGSRPSSAAELKQAYRALGSRAVELLSLRFQTSQFGLPLRRTTLVLPVLIG